MNIQEGPRPVQGRPVELQLPRPPPVRVFPDNQHQMY